MSLSKKNDLFKFLFLILLFVRMFTNLLESRHLSIFNLIEFEVAPVSGILGLLIIFLFIIAVIFNRDSSDILKVNKLELSIIIFLIFIIFSFLVNLFGGTLWIGDFIKEFLRVSSIFCVYYIVKTIFVTNDDFNLFLKFTLFLSIFPSIFGLHQLIFKSEIFGGDLKRLYGTTAHPNSFALLLIFFSVIVIYFIFISSKKINKIFLSLYLLLLFILLIFTYSRTGLIFFILFFLLLCVRFYRNKKYITILILILTFGVLMFPVYEQRMQVFTRIGESIYNIFVLGQDIHTSSFDWRLINYKYLLKAYVSKPLFGYGLGAANRLSPWKDYIYAHNDYIKILVETGLMGLLGFLSVLGNLWYILFKKSKTLVKFEQKLFAFLMMCFFTPYIFACFFDNYFMDTFFQYLFWSQIALINNFNDGGVI